MSIKLSIPFHYRASFTFAPMIQIDDVLISRTIFQKKFVCDLSACKGACCVDGEGGAPLTDEEIEINNFKTYKVKYSDHYPIMARLNF